MLFEIPHHELSDAEIAAIFRDIAGHRLADASDADW